MIYAACGDDADDSGGLDGGAGGNAGASGSGEAPSGAGGEIAHAGTSTTGGSESSGGQGGAPESSGGSTTGGSGGSATAGTSTGGSATSGNGGSATAGTSTAGGSSDGGSAGAGTAGEASGGVSGQGGSEPAGGLGGATGGTAGDTGEGGTGGAGGDAAFCAALGTLPAGVSARQCFDFGASSDAAAFTPEAGVWSVVDGRYQGTGPEMAASCEADGTWMSGSIVPGLSAADVRVRVELTGVGSADKVLILRSAGSGDRIELNFRANYGSGEPMLGGDLIVQELVGCAGAFRIPEGEVPIPHAITDTLQVEVELRGQSLTVNVDGEVVLDTVFTTPNLLRTGAGNVGLGVFIGGTVQFDNLLIEALDSSAE
jgi:hypothetical protein